MVSGWGFLPYWHPVHTSTASTCSWNQRIADCKAPKKEHDTNGYPCLLPTKWVANLSAQQWLADIFARAFPACSIRVNTVTRQKCPEWISWNTTRLSWSNTELHIKISLNHWTMNAHGSQNWVLNSMLSPPQKWPVPCDQGKAPRSWPSLIAPGCQEAEGSTQGARWAKYLVLSKDQWSMFVNFPLLPWMMNPILWPIKHRTWSKILQLVGSKTKCFVFKVFFLIGSTSKF